MNSITHSRSGQIAIHDVQGREVATVDDEAEIGPALKKLGVKPHDIVTVQLASGTEWKVTAYTYLRRLENA